MVSQDVNDTQYERIESTKRPVDSPTSKPIQEKPGYPRGIPGLREDDKPKSIPAAGKPSRPKQPEETRRYLL